MLNNRIVTQVLRTPQGFLSRYQKCAYASTTAASSKVQLISQEDFYVKNKRLNRPLSPHLTIYKFQITTGMSITHRATGLAMSVAMSGFAVAAMTLPGSYPFYLASLKTLSFGPAIITAAKFAIAWPFMYHLAAGLRHLAWDSGRGFTLKALYRTGYAVIGTSVLLSLAVAIM